MHQIWKKRTKWSLKGDSKKETALEFEVSNTRSNIPPCIWVEYCERWDKLNFWIRGLTLATCSSNIWSKLKSPTINILCCIDSSLINKIKWSMKEPRGPGMPYTIINKLVSFPISSTIGNTSKTLGISITSMMFTYSHCNIEPSHVVCSYECLSNNPGWHQYVLQDYHLYWFLWNRISWKKLSTSCHWENVRNDYSTTLNRHILIPFSSIKVHCHKNNDSFLIRTISSKADSFTLISSG